MTEPTTPQLTEATVRAIERDLVEWHPPGTFRDGCSALIRDWRAMRAAFDAEDKDHRLTIHTFRQQERIWQQRFDEREQENAALREQLAQSRSENERLASQLKQWQEEKDAKAGYL